MTEDQPEREHKLLDHDQRHRYGHIGVRKMEGSDAFAKLPALAERLGVEPVITSSASPPLGPRYMICTGSGEQRRCYDFFDLANAFLDQLDRGS